MDIFPASSAVVKLAAPEEAVSEDAEELLSEFPQPVNVNAMPSARAALIIMFDLINITSFSQKVLQGDV